MAQITKRNGKWQYRVFYKDIHGTRKSINKGGFLRKTEAQQAAREIELKKGQHLFLDKENVTFSAYYEEWINTYKIGKFSKGTENRYLNVLSVITKYFGNIPLKSISKHDYQRFMDNYASTRSIETIQKTNSYIRASVKDAIDEKIIYSDFTRKVQLNGRPGKDSELKFLNLDDAKKIINICKQEASLESLTKFEIYLGLKTGARFSEIAALTWNDVNYIDNSISINKTFDYVDKKNFKPTKNKNSERIISIDVDTIEILKKLQTQQSIAFSKKKYTDPLNLVFRNCKLETPTDNAVNKALIKLEKRVDVKNIVTFHGLRHTHASILINNGITITYVSKRLGHKNINVTTNIYSHLLQETYNEQSKITTDLLKAIL